MHSYTQACPLHPIVKDIVYMQAQRGQAEVLQVLLHKQKLRQKNLGYFPSREHAK